MSVVINENLLAKYFAGETSVGEEVRVKSWLAESPENQGFYDSLKKIWDESGELSDNFEVDTEVAWQKLKFRIQQPEVLSEINISETKTINFPTKKPIFNLYRIGLAASILLFFTLGIYFFNRKPKTLIFATQNFTASVKLPDGSSVFLNRNSQLSYPARFSGDIREVSFTGEGFFEIQRLEKQPFIIHAGKVDVKVLGTSFHVKTTPDQQTEVIVKTGKVQVSTPKEKTVLLPDQRVTSTKDKLEKSENTDKNFLSYKSHSFVFDSTKVSEIVEKVSEVYGVNIVISDEKLKNRTHTVTFENESLDRIVDIIAETFDLEVIKKENQIVLERE